MVDLFWGRSAITAIPARAIGIAKKVGHGRVENEISGCRCARRASRVLSCRILLFNPAMSDFFCNTAALAAPNHLVAAPAQA